MERRSGDTGAGRVVATIPVRDGPSDIAITPDGRLLYLCRAVSSQCAVLDAATGATVGAVAFASGETPMSVVMSQDGGTAYVQTFGSGVAVVDTAARTIRSRLHGGNAVSSDAVAVAPDVRHVYGVDAGENTFAEFDTSRYLTT